MADFSFEIPPLTAHLKPILDSYPLGGQILKELLQNAEDSGATKVKFFIDFTEYQSELLLHPGLKKFQGPALLVYNNSQFDENDFKSIISIRQSEKNNKPLKIGKFGLGFKSVYHLTDFPSLVSGRDLIIFDPHEKYLREHQAKNAMRFHYEAGKENEYFSKYPHQFEPYKKIEVELGEKIDLKNEFKGSLFRFPIRNKEAAQESKLCSTYKEVDKIIYDDILDSFFKDLNLILLFLRRIESVEIFELRNDKQCLVASTCIDFERSSQNLNQIRKNLFAKLVASVNSEKMMDEETFNRDDLVYNFKMAINTNILDKDTNLYSTTNDEYLISSFVKFKSCSEALKKLANKTYNFPACAVAYKLEKNFQEKFKQSRYFCFLPMPETIEKSGLPLHIHGSFGLRDDRRDFKWLSSDSKEDEAGKWNELMVNEVLNMVLIQLIDYAKELIQKNDSHFDLNNFFYLLPDLTNIGQNWKDKHLRVFLTNLSKNNLVLNRCSEWSNINQIYLTNKMDLKIEEFLKKNELVSNNCLKATLYACFDPKKLSAISIPDHVLAIFENYNQLDNLNYVNEEIILEKMRNKLNYEKITEEQKMDLLNYFIQSVSSLKMLDKIELLPLKNGTWTCFNQSNVFYFKNSEQTEIFKGIDHLIFDDSKLNKLSKDKLFNNLLEECDGRNVLFDHNYFGILFEKSLKSEYHFDDIERVWKFILTHFYDSLTSLEHLPLIPNETDGKIEFLMLKDKKKNFKYFTIDFENESLNKLKNFFEKNSNEKNRCYFFERLPQALVSHPKKSVYVSIFNKDGLIDCLLNLDRYCSNSMIDIKDLIKNSLNSQQKDIIATCLNSIENLPNENFVTFVTHKLPIFKAINKESNFFTIQDADFRCLRAQMDIQNLPIDPSLIIIDANYAENLLSKLNLKDYRVCDLIEKSINYHCEKKDLGSIYLFIEWIMVNRFKKFNCMTMEDFFKNSIVLKPIFTNNLKHFKFLKDIYDPEDKFVKHFVAKELQLNEEYMNDIFYPCFKAYLRRDIKIQLFDEYFQQLDLNKSGLTEEEFLNKCKNVFEYMKTLKSNTIQCLIEISAKYQWLPSDGFDDWSKAKFYKSHELWDSKFRNLIKYVKPIFNSKFVPVDFKNKLNIISQNPNLEDVLLNLDFIISNQESIGLADLEPIYSYLQNLVLNSKYQADDLGNKLKSFFGTKKFVFDGNNSFQNSSNLIWKSELPDLSPHLTVLNLNSTFLKKFEQLYTKVFGVQKNLTLKILIDLLEKIKNISCNQNSILIFSIYNLIEQKYQQELLASDDLKSKFLLPVLNLNNNFEFEKIDKCVYLIETGDQFEFNSNDMVYDEILSNKINLLNEKGFKICSQKISVKFLRKLGVCSSIEKLMDVENMVIESFGQHEKLTDRIKELLDGYKDGISIFKEAIQNADDAGARIVKICYDKRQNNMWKNPGKLLDQGLVKCQGESLIFYNDAVFTDNDFKNLIRLGAGTKKDNKEKVGKFGLGFNTFYNVTDLPCVLSRDSLVLLDPNVKFMSNIIRNKGEPGKKINFKSINQFIRTNYCDQFKPFENLFGCDIFSENFFYNGTLIRLPLRNEPSEISSHIYNKESEVKSLLDILIKNAESLLLFTQSVHTIEFYVIPSQATSPDSKLLLRLEKKPHLYLEKFASSVSDEFLGQTKTLSACSKNPESNLKSAIILCNTVEFFENNFSVFSSNFRPDKQSSENYWLVVSSYNSQYLIKNKPIFENFIPCVGSAVKLDRIGNNFSIMDSYGQAFCFLPLPINSGLKFHVNAAFNISRDRLSFNENTKDDKVTDEKHKWNSYLVQPLVENLLLMINYTLESALLNENPNILSSMWPLDMKTSFFIDFEKNFYDTICLPNSNYRVFPSVLDQQNKYTNFDQALFVDFDFKDENIQKIALRSLKKIHQTKSLVFMPSKYLEVIKNKTNDVSKFVNDFSLLKILISNLSILHLDDYIELLKFFILEKSFYLKQLTKFGNVISEEKCIPTCNGSFKKIQELVDPHSNVYFESLFCKEDDMFPCEELIQNRDLSLKLASLGIKTKFLDNQTVIELAKKIQSSSDITKAKSLSKALSGYLYDYCSKKLEKNLDDLKESLNNINWMFAETKPEKWTFPWFKLVDKKFKPSELFSSKDKKLIGSIAPLYDQKCSNFVKFSNRESLQVLVIEQFKLLKELFERGQIEISKFAQYYEEFCKYLRDNSTEKFSSSKEQIDSQIQFFKKSLPECWIFCENNSQKNKFLSINSFAYQVENPAEPDLLSFPKKLIDDHKKENFFKKMGLIDSFSLESLRLKLENLKNKKKDLPLDASELDYCLKIVNEILHIDKYSRDSEKLSKMIDTKNFYLPDENCVLRRNKDMCYERSLGSLLAEHKIYPVHSSIAFKNFGINSSKSKVFSAIGTPLSFEVEKFGQKESLVDRLKDILTRYSTESNIFTELIQNADDAEATKISFILDTRELGNKCLPFDEMVSLQGPSICCYNNAIFTQDDLQGIINLSKGSKQKSVGKIGKFGIGFNSVYHLTDAPQFISDFSDFVFFDPCCKYFLNLDKTNPGIRIKNAKNNLKNELFSDVLSGFEFDGFPLENATMFRFPLRSGHSDISTSTFDIRRARNLMENFIETNGHDVILFLKNIREISFHISDSNGIIEKIDEIKIIRKENTEFEKDKKEYFNSNLATVPKKNIDYSIETKSFKCEKKFIIFEQFGFDSLFDKDDLIKKLKSRPLGKYFPNASLAFDLDLIRNQNFKKDFRIYNFLPLESEKSPLKCHINAYWALREENRTSLFDFGMRTKDADKETAEWLTNWNLGLVNLIIYPLFLEFIKKFHLIYLNNSNEKQNPDKFIDLYFSLLPNVYSIPESTRSYFENLCMKFYEEIYKQELIPIFNNEIKWFKPSELYFSNSFESYFTQNLFLLRSNDPTNTLCNIVWNADIKICRHKNLVQLFKQNANIILNLLTPEILVQGLRNFCTNIVDKKIQDSIFGNIDNLKLIFNYCLSNQVNLENCPLLLRQDGILTNFSINKRIIRNLNYKFENCNHLFLHEQFYIETSKPLFENFFRKININDLVEIIPCILDKKIYYIKQNMEYPNLNFENSPLIDKVVKLLINSIDNVENLNKNQIFEKLKPIEHWAIISVTRESKKYLMPIKEANSIILNKISLLPRDLNLPVYMYRNLESEFLKKIVQNLEEIDDLIEFLENQENNYDQIFKTKNRCAFLNFFDSNIQRDVRFSTYSFKNSKYPKDSIKTILKSFPIYRDIFDVIDTIENKEVILLDLEDMPETLRSFFRQNLNSEESYLSEFLEFAQSRPNCRIIENDFKMLYKFFHIETTDIEDLYFLFFQWVLSVNDHKLLQYHIGNLLSLGVENLKNHENLWHQLLKIKFIKIENNFYSVNQVYDPENELFKITLNNQILPSSLNNTEWRPLLTELGLRTIPKEEDCILIAQKLRDKYLNKEINRDELTGFSKLLLNEISKFEKNASFIDEIKNIKFIPILNSYELDKIKSSGSIHGELICLNNSVNFCGENHQLAWLIKPVLPFCISLKKTADYLGIIDNVSIDLLAENFLLLISILSEKNYTKIKKINSREIKKLFKLYYEKFQSIKEETIIEKLMGSNFMIVERKCDKSCELTKAQKVVKNLNLMDQIDDFIYKLPDEFSKYWTFFNRMGAHEDIPFSLCQKVLEHHYHNNKKLTKNQFKDVLIVIKHLIFENSLNEENIPKLNLYFPNSNYEMKNLNTLYYMDKPSYESIIKNSDQIKSITLFDLKELINEVHHSYHSSSAHRIDQNCSQKSSKYKNIMFRQVSWLNIFENFEYFKIYRELAPRRLSDKLIERLKVEDEQRVLNTDLMTKLHSDEFFCSLIECLLSVNDEQCLEIENQLKEDIKICIKLINIYRMNDLVTQFFDSDSPENLFEDSEKIVKIARLKGDDGQGINFMIQNDCDNELDIFFYLAESIVEEIKKLFVLKSYENMDSIMASLDQRSYRFIYMIIKLLQNKDQNSNDEFIKNYKSKFPMPIV